MRYLEIDVEPVAIRVWYEKELIYIQLEDGRVIGFPAAKNRRFAKANPEQISKAEIICSGTGIHWEELDEDLSVTGILAGRFG